MPHTTNGRPLTRRAPEGRIASTALAGDRRPEPSGIDELADRMDSDYQVKLARQTLEARIQTIPVNFSVESPDERSQALKEQLEDLWETALPQALRCIPEGRVAFEKVYGFEGPNLSVIRKLEALPFSKTEMVLAEDGSFAGIKLKPKGKRHLTITPDKAWWLALDPTPLEPHGRSRYLGAAFQSWKTRQTTLKLRDKFLRRFALGQAIYRGPAVKEDEDGNNFDNWQKVYEAYDLSRGGGINFFENERDENGEYVEGFEQLPEVKDGEPIENSLDSQDAEQIRAFGFSEKTVTEGQSVGSFAMVKSQMSLLDAVALGILAQIVDSFQLYVVDKSVELNGTARIEVNYPKMRETVDDYILEIVKGWLTDTELSPFVRSGAVDVGQLLRSIGIPVSDDVEARIQAMITTARVEPQSDSVLQVPTSAPRGGLSHRHGRAHDLKMHSPGNVPLWETVVDDSLLELDRLWVDIERTLAALHRGESDDGTLGRLVARINRLNGDVAVAGRVLGMLSPWQPRLTGSPLERNLSIAGIDNPFLDAPEGSVWRFPWIEEALAYLEDLGIITRGEMQAAASAERRNVFEVAGLDDPELVQQLKDAVADSLGRGESLQTFRQRIGDDFGLKRAQTETLYRTHTHRAYVAGQERALNNHIASTAFPFVLFNATLDTRVRPEHEALDGFVVRRGTPEHQLMLRVLEDWNCRCAMIPLSREDAEDYDVKEWGDIPPEVVAIYAG